MSARQMRPSIVSSRSRSVYLASGNLAIMKHPYKQNPLPKFCAAQLAFLREQWRHIADLDGMYGAAHPDTNIPGKV
eukprot:1087293-Pelagomonas_calceolata.AAC.1